jgi:hypothetical protein
MEILDNGNAQYCIGWNIKGGFQCTCIALDGRLLILISREGMFTK